MALSRIWSAFIIIAILVAGVKCIVVDGQSDIFSRMVTGKSDDAYNYYPIGTPTGTKYASIDSFSKAAEPFAYKRKDKPEDANILLTDNLSADSVKILKAKYPALRVFTFKQVMNRLQKPIDGIIETCKTAVNICLGLIGIMAGLLRQFSPGGLPLPIGGRGDSRLGRCTYRTSFTPPFAACRRSPTAPPRTGRARNPDRRAQS